MRIKVAINFKFSYKYYRGRCSKWLWFSLNPIRVGQQWSSRHNWVQSGPHSWSKTKIGLDHGSTTFLGDTGGLSFRPSNTDKPQ